LIEFIAAVPEKGRRKGDEGVWKGEISSVFHRAGLPFSIDRLGGEAEAQNS
jgi:hypothetical protein